MKKFDVRITETLTRVVSIEAESEEEALEEADMMYRDGSIILTYEDCCDDPEFDIDRTFSDEIWKL